MGCAPSKQKGRDIHHTQYTTIGGGSDNNFSVSNNNSPTTTTTEDNAHLYTPPPNSSLIGVNQQTSTSTNSPSVGVVKQQSSSAAAAEIISTKQQQNTALPSVQVHSKEHTTTTVVAHTTTTTASNKETAALLQQESTKTNNKKNTMNARSEPNKVTQNNQNNNYFDTPQPSSSSGKRFEELYRLKGVLGTGAFSTVREGHHRSSSTHTQTFAIKCVNRRKLSEEDEAALLDEVSILSEMKHHHIIRLYDFFTEPTTYYLVMERMSGGELFDRIVAKAYYNEKEARNVCKIVLEAVTYCHEHHVAHRDLKPENLLLLSEDDDSAVKIADFGFAKKVYEQNSLTTQCGTPGYVAPEILEGIPYDERADMWSVGVILYILLGGYPPFIENNQRDLFKKIRRGEYEFHEEYWGTVSTEAKELISQLLTVDPVKRLDGHQALENPWITDVSDAELAKKDLGAQLEKFRNFNAKRKFKAAVSTVMAVNKLQSLGKEFIKSLS